MDVEKAFQKIGYFGPYQIFIWLFVMFYSALPGVSSQLFLMFANILPEWSCDGEDGVFGQDCTVYKNCSNFTSKIDFHSIVEEYDLACSKSTYVFFEFLEVTGRLIGAILGGIIIDKIGRKWSTFWTYTLLAVTGYGSGLSTSTTMFVTFRFLSGVIQPVASVAVNTYIFELIDAKHRPLVRTFGGWSIFAMIYAGIAWLCGNWRTLAFVTFTLSIPQIIITGICGVESPRWLIMKHRIDEAKASFKRIAKYNGKANEFKELVWNEQKSAESGQKGDIGSPKHYQIWHLVGSKRLSGYTMVMCSVMFCLGLNKTGVLFSLKLLFGNKYTNFLVQAGVTQTVMALLMLLELYGPGIGRKAIAVGATGIYVALLGIIVAVTALRGYISHGVVTSVTQYCALFSLSGMHSLNGFLFIIISEIYPTSLRATAFSLCNCFFYIGGTASSYIANYLNDFWPALSFAVFGVLGMISIVLMLFQIPETKHANLDVQLKKVGLTDIISKKTTV